MRFAAWRQLGMEGDQVANVYACGPLPTSCPYILLLSLGQHTALQLVLWDIPNIEGLVSQRASLASTTARLHIPKTGDTDLSLAQEFFLILP